VIVVTVTTTILVSI